MREGNLDLGMPIDEFLDEAFEQNYQALRLEVGRALAPNIKEAARRQVALYWRKLRGIAESVTDTEVRLMLPNQRSPLGRPYAIEGIVDIVREKGYTVMYDLKSLDADYVRANVEWFERQLNVYAYIWQNLRGEALQQTAIIATAYPKAVEEALESGDEGYLAYSMAQWNPVVQLDFDASRVDETIEEFGQVVDAIEDGAFGPPPPKHLNARQGATRQRFATAVCNECDARFSCASYRRWAAGQGRRAARLVRQYFVDDERWRTANLEATPDREDLAQDFIAR